MPLGKRRGSKSGNGENRSPIISLNFNLDDPDEALAFEMAQRLAMPHGRRKRVLISFLLALYEMEQRTGGIVDADGLSAEFIARSILGGGGQGEYRQIVQEDLVVVNTAFADPKETEFAIAESMGDLFG